jgi:pyruvate/2-oxoacid:ferredoxin oxidoreductase alpha subunit
MDFDELEAHSRKLEAKYKRRAQRDARRRVATEDAEIVLVGYGIVGAF